MTIKFYCDICNNEIIGQLYTLSVEPFDIVSVNMRKHICEKCLKELENKIESMHEKYKKNKEAENG